MRYSLREEPVVDVELILNSEGECKLQAGDVLLLKLTKHGELFRYKEIPDNLGFQTDPKGHLIIKDEW